MNHERLLQALNQPSTSKADDGLSCFDRFRRPASFAYAGGLSAAVFAIVLGAAAEDIQPAAPAPIPPISQPSEPESVESRPKAKTNAEPAKSYPLPAPVAAIAPPTSARGLFYAAEPDGLNQRIMEPEQEQGLKSTSEARRPLRSEPKMERFPAAGAPAQVKPLGLRYGFAIRTTDGKAQETDAATALNSGGQARLTIEVNQDAYVQIWKMAGASPPQLWFPTKETGQISIKVPAGRRQGIPVTEETGAFTLTVRLSRVPFGPITEQEAAMLDIPSNQLVETITPHDPTGFQEQATYVVNPNPSPTVQLIVEIPLTQ